MIASKYESCDVRRIIEQRFKFKPKRVEEWFAQTDFNLNAVSSQTLTYFWNFSDELPKTSSYSAFLTPLYFGSLDLIIGNPSSVSTSGANAQVQFSRWFVQNIATAPGGLFYNSYGQLFRNYGVGTYPGEAFPAQNIVEYYPEAMSGNMQISYQFEIDVTTDITGVVFMSCYASFSGFKITMI